MDFDICHSGSSWAALDIFDHPKNIGQRRESVKRKLDKSSLDSASECFLKGDYEGAYKACQRLLNYLPDRRLKADISYLMGLSCLKLNRFLEARSYFNDVILEKGIAEELKRDASMGIADSYFLEGHFNEAFDVYKKIQKDYSPGQIGGILYYKMAEVLYRLDRPEEAGYYLNKLKSDFPLSFEAHMTHDAAREGQKADFYSIQVGCFTDRDNADRLCEKMVKEGFDAYILESHDAGGSQFRVRIGRLRSLDETQSLESRIKKAGYTTKICP